MSGIILQLVVSGQPDRTGRDTYAGRGGAIPCTPR